MYIYIYSFLGGELLVSGEVLVGIIDITWILFYLEHMSMGCFIRNPHLSSVVTCVLFPDTFPDEMG